MLNSPFFIEGGICYSEMWTLASKHAVLNVHILSGWLLASHVVEASQTD